MSSAELSEEDLKRIAKMKVHGSSMLPAALCTQPFRFISTRMCGVMHFIGVLMFLFCTQATLAEKEKKKLEAASGAPPSSAQPPSASSSSLSSSRRPPSAIERVDSAGSCGTPTAHSPSSSFHIVDPQVLALGDPVAQGGFSCVYAPALFYIALRPVDS